MVWCEVYSLIVYHVTHKPLNSPKPDNFTRMSNCASLDARTTIVGCTEDLIDSRRLLHDSIQAYIVRLNSVVSERAAEIGGTCTTIPLLRRSPMHDYFDSTMTVDASGSSGLPVWLVVFVKFPQVYEEV